MGYQSKSWRLVKRVEPLDEPQSASAEKRMPYPWSRSAPMRSRAESLSFVRMAVRSRMPFTLGPPSGGDTFTMISWGEVAMTCNIWACANIPFTYSLSLHRGMHRGCASGLCIGACVGGVCIGVCIGHESGMPRWFHNK